MSWPSCTWPSRVVCSPVVTVVTLEAKPSDARALPSTFGAVTLTLLKGPSGLEEFSLSLSRSLALFPVCMAIRWRSPMEYV